MRKLKHLEQVYETSMCMSKLESDIKNLLLRYSSGTGLQHIKVKEFNLIRQLIQDIIEKPENYLTNI